MPKFWNYTVGQKVVVNEKATGLPDSIGKIGEINGYRYNCIYDYYLKLDNGEEVRVKEEEINLIEEEV